MWITKKNQISKAINKIWVTSTKENKKKIPLFTYILIYYTFILKKIYTSIYVFTYNYIPIIK